MRPAWRISINALSGRASRTALLVAAVALSTALVAAVACAMASIQAAMALRIEQTLGRAQIRIKEVAGDRFDTSILQQIEQDPDVALAAPRIRGSIRLQNRDAGVSFTAPSDGVDPAREARVVYERYAEGRALTGEDEIVLNRALAEELKAEVGTELLIERAGPPLRVRVVGIEASAFDGAVRRFESRLLRETLERAVGRKGSLTEIAVVLRDGVDPEQAAVRMQRAAPSNILIRPTALVTSGVRDTLQAQRIGFLLSTVIANIASAFIILTGLTTGVIERQRELAIMRCIGARRSTLAIAQIMGGALVGVLGAAFGTPLGVLLAYAMTLVYPDRLPAGLHVSVLGLIIAGIGAVCAGVLGSIWPAVAASRAAPLEAMTRRAAAVTWRTPALAGVIGIVAASAQTLIVRLPDDPSLMFWGHMSLGVPLMIGGYFVMGVPVVALAARLVGPGLARVLRVPRTLLLGSIRATPVRHGLSAGALMLGFALMTDLWTTGSSVLRGWLDSVRFPDAFVQDLNGLDGRDIDRLRALDFVEGAASITLFRIDANVFGLREIRTPPTFFVAFDPEPFFAMTRLHWEAGDPEYARRRLDEGGAVLVAKEFLIAREGYAIGDSFIVEHQGERFEFEVVGAVSSPGLDVVGYGFDLGREYSDVAIGSVFGTRADLKRVFKSEAVHLVQLGYSRDIPDEQASDAIRKALAKPSALVGSGREIKQEVLNVAERTMRLASIVALAVMMIGSLGVANVVLAGIQSRRFEFGVLRAVGGHAGLLVRFLVAELIVVIIAAAVLGTMLGMQAAFTAQRFYEVLAGVRYEVRPPITPVLIGWALLATVTLAVVAPMLRRVARTRCRELLASTRG